MTAREILDIYIQFFEKKGHKRIENSPLIPKDDPTTLFTSSGMQSIIKYLLGEPHPQGKRLVNVQNCFRAVDIDEVGDNRHTTFFRMLGNWSLGDYFKAEQIPWFWELLVNELKIDPKRLYISVFEGYKNIERDEESAEIWRGLFNKAGIDPANRIFYCGVDDNWWSRSGTPDEMPEGEPGGPDTEVYFDMRPDEEKINNSNLRKYTASQRLLEIGNSVFMTYKKVNGEFVELPQKNVDFGGGIERLLQAAEEKEDMFQTSLFWPIIGAIEKATGKRYKEEKEKMRIVSDHLRSAVYIANDGVIPSNKGAGYILRRLIRRSFDNLGVDAGDIIHKIVVKCSDTDPSLLENYETIKNVILQEIERYKKSLKEAKKFVEKKYRLQGGEIMGTVTITADDAFNLYTSLGLSPTQIRSLGYNFNEQDFANLMEKHQEKSREARKK